MSLVAGKLCFVEGILRQPLSPHSSVTRCFSQFFDTIRSHSNDSPPINLGIHFVPQQQAWIAERFGKYSKTMLPGLNFLIPVVDRVRKVQILQEIVIPIPSQSAVTRDNVGLHLDGVLYVKVHNPFDATYGVEDVENAITQLAQTTMRSEIGKISLDHLFKERESLNHNIVTAINGAAYDAWGIKCLRYEIRDISLPAKVVDAMQLQVEAERKKRASILESEGRKASEINIAEGMKQSRILASEADKTERVNKASGEANAIEAVAEAKAVSIERIAVALEERHGNSAASLSVAEQYVSAFSKLAKEGNTILLPGNAGDIGSAVAQAMAVYSQIHEGKAHIAKPATLAPMPEDKN